MWSSDNMFGQRSTIYTWNRREVCNSNAHDHSYTSSNRQSCQKISFFGSMGIEAGCRHVLVNLNINTLQPTFTLTSSCHNHLELATTSDRSWGMLPQLKGLTSYVVYINYYTDVSTHRGTVVYGATSTIHVVVCWGIVCTQYVHVSIVQTCHMYTNTLAGPYFQSHFSSE